MFFIFLSYFLFPCRSEQGGLVLPKETQELLANLTVGSSDIQPPGFFHYLPHLVGKPDGLRPGFKISQGRLGGKCTCFCLLLFHAFDGRGHWNDLVHSFVHTSTHSPHLVSVHFHKKGHPINVWLNISLMYCCMMRVDHSLKVSYKWKAYLESCRESCRERSVGWQMNFKKRLHTQLNIPLFENPVYCTVYHHWALNVNIVWLY